MGCFRFADAGFGAQLAKSVPEGRIAGIQRQTTSRQVSLIAGQLDRLSGHTSELGDGFENGFVLALKADARGAIARTVSRFTSIRGIKSSARDAVPDRDSTGRCATTATLVRRPVPAVGSLLRGP